MICLVKFCPNLGQKYIRAVLLNFLDTNLYERQGKAINNFKTTLPAYTGNLAQEITKDLYNFDFVTVNRDYNERELKDALTEKVIKLLMEMGKGYRQIGTCINIVDDIVRTNEDGKTIGLIICKEKDNVLTKY